MGFNLDCCLELNWIILPWYITEVGGTDHYAHKHSYTSTSCVMGCSSVTSIYLGFIIVSTVTVELELSSSQATDVVAIFFGRKFAVTWIFYDLWFIIIWKCKCRSLWEITWD